MKQLVSRKIGKKPISHEKVSQLFGANASLDEIRQAAARICRDYLYGRWKEVPADQLIVKRISGGLSNLLYYVSLPNATGNGSGCDNSEGASSSCKVQTACPAASDVDVNKNEPNINDLYPIAGECNGNKRKRYDSNSSSSMTLKQKEPEEVLLRIYGQSHGEDALEAMITESVVFALLSERNFGPRLHGIFPGGRIEQYIPARALHTDELVLPEISIRIAEKMGEIHTLNIPMSKEPDWAWNCMERWQRHLPAIFARTDWQENEKYAQIMRSVNYTKEMAWLKSIIQGGNNYPVMFCHNDLQEGNILLKPQDKLEISAEDSGLDNISMHEEDDDTVLGQSDRPTDLDTSADSAISSANDAASPAPDLRIIDFEYCAYNYRGFDLANHFLEWTFDYSNPEFPFYYHRKEHFPTKEQRHAFIRTYLKRINDADDDWEPSQEDIEDVDHEVKLFRMLSHLFWSLWSVVNVTSNIEFGYWHYAVTRIKEFKELKQNFITDNMMTV